MLEVSFPERPERFDLSTPVRILAFGRENAIYAKTTNISEYGMFVGTPDMCAQDAEVLCDILLPVNNQHLAIRGRIVWTRNTPDPGMGIEFVDLTLTDRNLLQDTLSERTFRDSSKEVKVWFETLTQPINSKAIITPHGLLLRSDLRFLRLFSSVIVYPDENMNEKYTGILQEVRLKQSQDPAIPELLVHLKLQNANDIAENSLLKTTLPATTLSLGQSLTEDSDSSEEETTQSVEDELKQTIPIETRKKPTTIFSLLALGVVCILTMGTWVFLSGSSTTEPTVIPQKKNPLPPLVVPVKAPSPTQKEVSKPKPPPPSQQPSKKEPFVTTQNKQTSLMIPLQGNTEGATHYPLANPDGIAINVPQAFPIDKRYGTFNIKNNEFWVVWIRPNTQGSHVRILFKGKKPTYKLYILKKAIKVSLVNE